MFMYPAHGYAAIGSLSGLRVWAWRRLEKASNLANGWYGLPTPHGRTGPSQTNSGVMHSGCMRPRPPSTSPLRKTEVQRPAHRLLTFDLSVTAQVGPMSRSQMLTVSDTFS